MSVVHSLLFYKAPPPTCEGVPSRVTAGPAGLNTPGWLRPTPPASCLRSCRSRSSFPLFTSCHPAIYSPPSCQVTPSGAPSVLVASAPPPKDVDVPAMPTRLSTLLGGIPSSLLHLTPAPLRTGRLAGSPAWPAMLLPGP